MNESLEAEIFDKELENILAGRPVRADLGPEMSQDLAFAARLAGLDLSGENRAKRTILARAVEESAG